MKCLGWRNCIGTVDGLSYTYTVHGRNVTADIPLFRGINNTISLRFPAGDKDDEFRNQVSVIVSDAFGESRVSSIYPVTVSIIIIIVVVIVIVIVIIVVIVIIIVIVIVIIVIIIIIILLG